MNLFKRVFKGGRKGLDKLNVRMLVLLYTIYKYFELYGWPLYGRKKLQKLMFLVEHWDNGRIVKSTGLTGYKFNVWLYGPFSRRLYEDLEFLVDKGFIEEEVIGFDSRQKVENINLGFYDDNGYPKTIYVYKPCKHWEKYLKEIECILSKEKPEVIRRVSLVLEKFGALSPTKLEENINEMLGLNLRLKEKYWGKPMDSYIENEVLSDAKKNKTSYSQADTHR